MSESAASGEISQPLFPQRRQCAKPDGLTPVALRAGTPADRSLPPISFALEGEK